MRQQISLTCGKHSFVFRYPPGKEFWVVNALVELACSKRWLDFEFTWEQAALLSSQLGKHNNSHNSLDT